MMIFGVGFFYTRLTDLTGLIRVITGICNRNDTVNIAALKEHTPMNPWHITETAYDPATLSDGESIYTIGNGYFGTRGSFEEGHPGSKESTLLAGVFDAIAEAKEELADVPDWLPVQLQVNGEHFRLDRGKVLAYERTLDMQRGLLTRTVRWQSPKGVQVKIVSERFASLADDHLGAMRYSVTLEELPNGQETGPREMPEVEVTLWAVFNIATGNDNVMHWEVVEQGQEGELVWLHSQTRHSKVQLTQAMSFHAHAHGFQHEAMNLDFAPGIRLQGRLAHGETVTAEKLVMLYTSRDTADPRNEAITCLREITEAHGKAYDVQLTQHEAAWHAFWEHSDILIEGDDHAQQLARYSIYQLRINAPRHDERFSIGAKGLTGFGYHGHILHDTEIFMLPFFIYTDPANAKNLLMYRYRLLPAAREKARNNGYRGAQYPWESALDGSEATPDAMYLPEQHGLRPVLNGKLELHVTSSVAFATWQYWQVSGDDAFIREYGAEVLLSTAQFWASRAEHIAGRYEIRDVIGPDEWHEHVNNDTYTNYMARWNIQAGLNALAWLKQQDTKHAEQLLQKLELDEQELEHWRDVATNLYIPQDRATGRFEQFDGFSNLQSIDQGQFKDRTESYQVLLGMEKLQGIKIIKQADVLMLLTLLRDHFDLNTKRVNWDYYHPLTDHEHGSSLTPALHAILACELGLTDLAYQHLLQGALIDLVDLHGDTAKGIHLASCGAVWQALVFGFAGLTLTRDSYMTNAHLPAHWKRLSFSFVHNGQDVAVDIQ